MAALPAGLSLVFDCLRGTSPDTGHAVGAAALPYGFSAFSGYVVQRTSQGAFSAGDTFIRNSKTFIFYKKSVKQRIDGAAFNLADKGNRLRGQCLS